ncbi:glycosyltransferase family 2 protein [Ferrigenium sp. UT5]|uniref:glycosyltransferase family 2 protein n=1 Tax=Ferrigenium sp. UT5 TaxID=3242105 RepID=UPI003551B606
MPNRPEAPPSQMKGGIRLKSEGKKSTIGKPLVSIITATFNASEHLPNTIKSIRKLSYGNVEWIVVDGNSTDETVELLKQNEDVIDYWLSEPDGGIYDAWNKGISLARGDWIAFLGAGDSYNADAIDGYMRAIGLSSDVPEFVSSKVRLVDSKGLTLRVIGMPFKWETFVRYMTVAHVGALHHKSLFKKQGVFDTSYSLSADYEFLIRCGPGLKTAYLGTVTAEMLVGGGSNGYKGLFETYRIHKKYVATMSAVLELSLALAKRIVRPLFRGY